MKKIYDIVIFDLDGTLLDTIDDLGEAVNHALDQGGWPLHTMQEYRRMVGHGIRNLVQQALPESIQGDDSLVDSTLASFKSYYTGHIDVHTRPYDGIVALICDLAAAGTMVAVASNKFQSGAETLVSEFFGDIEFLAVLGNAEGVPLKPDAAIVRDIIGRSGISRPRVVMVGDSGTDMKTAANGGIPSIGVTWGFRPEEEIAAAGATHMVHSVEELRSALLS